MIKLSPRRALFIYEYLVDANGTRAAIAAGYAEASAAVTAARLLKDAEIVAVIESRQAKRAEKLEITAERTLQELAKIAYHDPGGYFDQLGNLLPIAKLGEKERAALEGFEVEVKKLPGGERSILKKIKKADRIRALELLGKNLRLWTDRVEGELTTATVKLTAEERATRVASLLASAAARLRTGDAA